MENKNNSPVNIRFVTKMPDVRNFSENIRSGNTGCYSGKLLCNFADCLPRVSRDFRNGNTRCCHDFSQQHKLAVSANISVEITFAELVVVNTVLLCEMKTNDFFEYIFRLCQLRLSLAFGFAGNKHREQLRFESCFRLCLLSNKHREP